MPLGDFNTVFNQDLDNVSGAKHAQRVVKSFQDCIATVECEDIWRVFNKDSKTFTWRKNKPLVARRLDYIFVSQTLLPYCTQASIVHFPMTDHKGVDVTVALDIDADIERGPGYFKLNNRVLTEQEFINQIDDVIDSTKAQFQAVLDPQMLWDLCKVKIAQKAKDYCVQRKKLSKTLEQLEKELSVLHEKLATTTDAETLNSYNKLQMEVDIKM
jgi:uncharacterized protein YlaN (UPF0358 family)